ncbi:serine/threonine-protein kinase polo [Anthonomus grandis grandis]|uniref:serine/threonine-protein kinase polo n=1 Tax=Anthonomus grandis grandis TaxID=2921223 RepID=UPI00216512D4|nr:serine/threonine-protein kinase polo [Anthonomus grandis grandis]
MSNEDDSQIPAIIYDAENNISYKKGRFFGKGGFAKCYEIINQSTMKTYAGKIVSKKFMAKQNQKEKMSQEIQIHMSLRHRNVVGFHGFFEDSLNIYIVLELCKRRSMMELHKRRKAITEPETRFYITQIVDGVLYLHNHRIIHRDLKLGNLFLNDDLHVKIGDFGLAAKIEYDGERKKTLCGTPNYIAPEILNKKGHSYEVDIWSVGCIMYTLLVGKPPFETSTLKETYAKIKKCDYSITFDISQQAKHMIMIMLQGDPTKRPKISQLAKHEFLTKGYCPASLPVSCLTMPPRFDNCDMSMIRSPAGRNNRGPLIEIQGNAKRGVSPKHDSIAAGFAGVMQANHFGFDAKENLLSLKNLLAKVIKSKPTLHKKVSDEMTDPAAQPTIWVSKWVDYSDKYGFGYQLSDESVGVMFNDTTRLILLANGVNVQYVDKNGSEAYMTINEYPKPAYEKKIKLLSYFNRYMKEHLINTGADIMKEPDTLSRTPHLHQWCRSTSGVLMQLNCGILQINFGDHTKIIMCPLMAAITYIAEDKSFRTFRFSTIEKYGCVAALYEKIRYAYDKITLLLEN